MYNLIYNIKYYIMYYMLYRWDDDGERERLKITFVGNLNEYSVLLECPTELTASL